MRQHEQVLLALGLFAEQRRSELAEILLSGRERKKEGAWLVCSRRSMQGRHHGPQRWRTQTPNEMRTCDSVQKGKNFGTPPTTKQKSKPPHLDVIAAERCAEACVVSVLREDRIVSVHPPLATRNCWRKKRQTNPFFSPQLLPSRFFPLGFVQRSREGKRAPQQTEEMSNELDKYVDRTFVRLRFR